MVGVDRRMELYPIEILGAGRVDPFLSYPVEKPDRTLHEVICHINLTPRRTHPLPGLVSDELPSRGTSPVNSTSMAMVSAALESPLLFDAMVFTGICHRAFCIRTKHAPTPRKLSHTD